jgi:hypothetical protein
MSNFKSDKQRRGFYANNKSISKTQRLSNSMRHKKKYIVEYEEFGNKYKKEYSNDATLKKGINDFYVKNKHNGSNYDVKVYDVKGNNITESQNMQEISRDIIEKNRTSSSLTPYEHKAVETSINEERQAQRDYARRSEKSRSKRVKSTFNHIKKEEHTHEEELVQLDK